MCVVYVFCPHSIGKVYFFISSIFFLLLLPIYYCIYEYILAIYFTNDTVQNSDVQIFGIGKFVIVKLINQQINFK